jgi:predicted enzyme related to lactoylglutathione lyase
MLSESVPAWFELPAADFERSIRFYETVLDTRLDRETMGPMQMAVFPHKAPAPGGAVVRAEGYVPNAQASVVYLNLSVDLAKPLARVAKAGGKVLVEKTALPDGMGHYAQFLDSEGNRVGFFSVQ